MMHLFKDSKGESPTKFLFILVIIAMLVIILPLITGALMRASDRDTCIEYLRSYGYWVLAAGECVDGNLMPCTGSSYTFGSPALTWLNGSFDDIEAPVGRGATLTIAASDSSAQSIAQANYICDGTDDDVQIQAAIDALPVTGGSLFFMAGEYVASSPIFTVNRTNITFNGEGYSSYIRSIDDANWTVGVDGGDALFDTTGCTGLSFRNLRFLIYTDNAAGECIDMDLSVNTNVDRCWLYVKNAGAAINIDAETGTASDHMITNNFIHTNNAGIILMAKNGGINTRIIVSDNIIVPWETDGAAGNDPGIQLGSAAYAPAELSDVTIADNIIGGTYKFWPGIRIWNTFDDLVIQGNRITSMSYGIQYSAACNRSVVTGNNFRDCSADGISTFGNDPYMIYRDNMNYMRQGESRFGSGTLTAGNAGSIGFAWHTNVVGGQEILIKKVVIEVTTAGGTVGSHLDVGIADNAAGLNRGIEFFDNLLLNSVQINDSCLGADGGTQTKWVFCDDSSSATNGWIVGEILDANAANLVGTYYIEYICRTN